MAGDQDIAFQKNSETLFTCFIKKLLNSADTKFIISPNKQLLVLSN